jgi:radical SAM family uncharacterized protein/radical SAM-linked protein
MKNKTIENKLINSVLNKVTKPGRYIGNEINLINKDIDQVDVRFALAFPELYEIGMSSQAIGVLYHNLNKIDYVWAERVFAPWPDMENELRTNNIPLYALESFSPLKDFDIIGFTLQYELTYTNILNMLELAGIPVWAKERTENDPLIIAGGPCSCNPEPVADFFDVIFIGDGEEGLVEICEIVRQAKSEKTHKNEILVKLSQIRGVYVPSFYDAKYNQDGMFSNLEKVNDEAPDRILSRILPELKNEYYSEKPIVPLIEVTHDRLAVEVMRGCTEGCRYCNAGMIYRPTRERSEDDIVNSSVKAIENSGYEEMSFLSLSISDYSALNSLMVKQKEALEGKHINVSFPSMRLDSFSEEIAEFARSVRKSGFTFAPEAGSVRLRKVINKNITDEDLIKAVEIALENGWKLLKFYFMIGLPTETKEDVEAIGNLIERLVQLSKKYGRVKFNVSVSPHSPKSNTPFQWEKQDTKEQFWSKIDIIKNKLYRFKQVNLSWRDPAVSEIECILGRGDRRMSQVIHNAWKKGAKFDGWNEFFQYETWQNAFNESGFDMSLNSREIPEHQILPWDHIDKGVTKNFLLKEKKNAYSEINVIDCKQGTCFGCGIQRKNSFREFAECYTKLELHNSNSVSKSEEQSTKVKQIASTESGKDVNKEKVKIRMRFQKVGYSKFISHLDLVRLFDRACRYAGIPVAYSQGFNPRPKISFCQPLALGQSSESEYLDIELDGELNIDLKNKINEYLPEGIKILDVKTKSGSSDVLSASINLMDYEIDISDSEIMQQQIEDFLNNHEIFVERNRKGITKQVNIRPFVDTIKNSKKRLQIRTRSIKGNTARINEILEYLFGNNAHSKKYLSIHRKNQYIQNETSILTPMEIL